jgi:small-conductance mechanosensitive channel
MAAVSFAIATTVQEFLGSLVFIFIKHPYDVGDRVDITGVELVVEHVSLLFTVFRQIDTDGIVQIPNIVNNTQWIKNVSRSKAMKERYNFAISPKTNWSQLEDLKAELQAFVLEPQNKRDYQPTIDVELISIENMEKLQLRVEICQKVRQCCEYLTLENMVGSLSVHLFSNLQLKTKPQNLLAILLFHLPGIFEARSRILRL